MCLSLVFTITGWFCPSGRRWRSRRRRILVITPCFSLISICQSVCVLFCHSTSTHGCHTWVM